MNKVAELEIYQTAYVLSREIYKIQQKMPKALKFSLGSKLLDSIMIVIRSIVIASSRKDKVLPLEDMTSEIEVLWTWLRMGYDLKPPLSGNKSHRKS